MLELQMRMLQDTESVYWHAHFAQEPYYVQGRSFDQYAPAFALGTQAALRYPDAQFADIQTQLEHQWSESHGESKLPWSEVALAVHAAWRHAQQRSQELEQSEVAAAWSMESMQALEQLQVQAHQLSAQLMHCQRVPMNPFAAQVIARHGSQLEKFADALMKQLPASYTSAAAQDVQAASWRQRWMSWVKRYAHQNPEWVFATCAQREHALIAAYELLLTQPLPMYVQRLLRLQLRWLQTNHRKLLWVKSNWPLAE